MKATCAQDKTCKIRASTSTSPPTAPACSISSPRLSPRSRSLRRNLCRILPSKHLSNLLYRNYLHPVQKVYFLLPTPQAPDLLCRNLCRILARSAEIHGQLEASKIQDICLVYWK